MNIDPLYANNVVHRDRGIIYLILKLIIREDHCPNTDLLKVRVFFKLFSYSFCNIENNKGLWISRSYYIMDVYAYEMTDHKNVIKKLVCHGG